MKTLEELIIDECEVDDVGLWEIVKLAEELVAPGSIREQVLVVVRSLLENGHIVAEDFHTDRGWSLWVTSADETADRIIREWTALGRAPTLGEIVWFTTPSRAKQRDSS